MKRILLLFSILIATVAPSGYGQTCSESLISTTVVPCLEQPFTISTPNFIAFGGSVTWEVSTDAEGPWTVIGTSNFSEQTGSAKFTVTPSEAGLRYYRGVRPGNCTYAPIPVTVGTGAAPAPPVLSASSYCNGVSAPTLTASGAGDGIYTWYRVNSVLQVTQVQSDARNTYIVPKLPDGSFFESSFRYYVTYSNGTCTSNQSNTLVVYPSGALPPAPTITSQSASICINQSTTLTATGASGTIRWYGTNPTVLLGEGSSIVISPTNTRNYFAGSTIDGSCTSAASNQINVAVALPTATTTLPASQDFVVGGAVHVLTDNDCKIFAKFGSSEPEGSELFSKTVNAKVSFDNTVKTFNGMPYVQRHFDFHPTEPLTPAYFPYYTITMYFTQAEFDEFNVTSSVKLPLNQADLEGYASNLRILHAYGIPNALPATPGNYSSGNVIEDCLACTTVGWNTEYNVWEVSINTRGFSGFFITATGATSLPVTLVNFNAVKAERYVVLNWETSEETNSDQFEIQHSADGKQWTVLGEVNATGESKTLQQYSFTHSNPAPGENLYRLKMVDGDGTFAFSKIVLVRINGATDLTIFPNPATNAVSVISRVLITGYQLLAADGKMVRQNANVHTRKLEVENLNIPAGFYLLKLSLENGTVENRKIVLE